MGSNDFNLELEEFRTHIPRFEELSHELESEVRTLIGDLGAVTGKWGSDEFGNLFANNYLPKAQQAVQEFGKVVESLSGLSKNAGTVANTLESADQSLADVLNRAKSALDQGKA